MKETFFLFFVALVAMFCAMFYHEPENPEEVGECLDRSFRFNVFLTVAALVGWMLAAFSIFKP